MNKIAFDTETKGFSWYDGEIAFLGSWANADEEGVCNLETQEGKDEFERILLSADLLVAHNFSFDCHQVRETMGLDLLKAGIEFDDTDIMARIAYPTGQRRGSYKLKDLAATFVNEDAKKESEAIEEMAKEIGISLKSTPESFRLVWQAYPDVMELYAAKDARYTYDLHDHLVKELGDDASYALEREVIPVLTAAEARGVALDQAVVEALVAEYEPLALAAREELVTTLGEPAIEGEGSKAALLEALHDLGVPLYRKTKDGGLATHKWALEEFQEDYPILRVLMDWRVYEKFLATYLRPAVGRDVVHTSFKQSEAWTGRMSSARPNLQNIPKRAGKGVRAMFVPREGHCFVVYDYESIEVRLLAYYLGPAGKPFADLIAEGRDPHAWMASEIHGGTPDEYVKGTDQQPLRDEAKNTLFAISYGAGAPRVSDMNGIPKDQAKALIKTIKSNIPGFYKLNRRLRDKVEAVGYINTAFGKRQPVGKDKAYVALNALIQGTAAQIMKKGLVNTANAVRELDAIPLLVVHDEVLVESPLENAEKVAALVAPAMTSAFDMYPALSVEGGIVTTNYADA